ncbi:hypothetical protein SNE40_002865 [Patella caerulea]|uniref:Uncharacterized protein n=1 Tax=Patella caerulea TaxID=87958 RepID=A0AAN8K1W1_PATCE
MSKNDSRPKRTKAGNRLTEALIKVLKERSEDSESEAENNDATPFTKPQSDDTVVPPFNEEIAEQAQGDPSADLHHRSAQSAEVSTDDLDTLRRELCHIRSLREKACVQRETTDIRIKWTSTV